MAGFLRDTHAIYFGIYAFVANFQRGPKPPFLCGRPTMTNEEFEALSEEEQMKVALDYLISILTEKNSTTLQ